MTKKKRRNEKETEKIKLKRGAIGMFDDNSFVQAFQTTSKMPRGEKEILSLQAN